MFWTPEQDARLRVLWDEGLSASEIGRRMGVSKNAVIGRAHRTGCARRASPLKAQRDPNAPEARKHRRIRPLQPQALPTLPEPPRPLATVLKPRPASACCWPIGEPGTRDFRFCDGAAVSGKPYCHSHCLIAFKREAA